MSNDRANQVLNNWVVFAKGLDYKEFIADLSMGFFFSSLCSPLKEFSSQAGRQSEYAATTASIPPGLATIVLHNT